MPILHRWDGDNDDIDGAAGRWRYDTSSDNEPVTERDTKRMKSSSAWRYDDSSDAEKPSSAASTLACRLGVCVFS